MTSQRPPPHNPSAQGQRGRPLIAAAAPTDPGVPNRAGEAAPRRPPGRPPLSSASSSTASSLANQPTGIEQLTQEQRTHFNRLIQDMREGKLAVGDFQQRARRLLGEHMFQTVMQNMMQRGNLSAVPSSSSSNMPTMQMQAPLLTANIRPLLPTNAGLSNDINAIPTATNITGGAMTMDSAALQDVIQYAGVDLKAESELILSQQRVYHGGYDAFGTGGYAGLGAVPLRDDRDRFLAMSRLKAVLVQAARMHGLAAVDPQAVPALQAILLKKLALVLMALVQYSRQRVDLTRRHYKIKVDNDPKQQLWLIEQLLTRFPPSSSSSSSSASSAPQPTTNIVLSSASINNALFSTIPPLKSPPATNGSASTDDAAAKKRKLAGPTTTTTEDVRNKLTNQAVAQATGLKRKSWMTASTSTGTIAGSAAKESDDDTEEEELKGQHVVGGREERERKAGPSSSSASSLMIIDLSQAPSASPLTERDLFERFQQRTIGKRDLCRYLEEQLSGSLLGDSCHRHHRPHHYERIILHALYNLV